MKIFTLVSALLIPIVMIVSGGIFWKTPPAPNGFAGYRTRRSQSSEKVWYAAQSIWGKISLFTNIPQLVISAVAMVLCMRSGMSDDGLADVMITLIVVQTIVIFADIAVTENKLRSITGK